MEESNEETILYSAFNYDNTSFCVGTNDGFQIFNSYPLKCKKKTEIDGGISIIDIINEKKEENEKNILAFVGTGKNVRLLNKVILWDSIKSKVLCEIVSSNNIKNIKLKKTKLFIVTENNINVFSRENTQGSYELIDKIQTCHNKNGIIGISLDPKINMMAYLSEDIGKIIIKNYDEKKNESKIINAHQSEIIALVMNYDGSLIASSSEKGTIIKIFKTKDQTLLKELRRGTEPATIYSLAFDINSKYIACSSNKGTIHIFHVKSDENEVQNQKSIIGSMISFIGIHNQYLCSEWSFAQYRLNYSGRSIVAFSPDNSPSIIVITADGKYYKGSFDPKSIKECKTTEEKDLFSIDIKKED